MKPSTLLQQQNCELADQIEMLQGTLSDSQTENVQLSEALRIAREDLIQFGVPESTGGVDGTADTGTPNCWNTESADRRGQPKQPETSSASGYTTSRVTPGWRRIVSRKGRVRSAEANTCYNRGNAEPGLCVKSATASEAH